jgi:hypothetical protein
MHLLVQFRPLCPSRLLSPSPNLVFHPTLFADLFILYVLFLTSLFLFTTYLLFSPVFFRAC